LDEKRTERFVWGTKKPHGVDAWWKWDRVLETPVGWETDRIVVVGKRTAWTNNKLGGLEPDRIVIVGNHGEVIPSGICWMRKMTEWVSGNHTGGITNGMWWMRNGKNVLAGMCAPFFLFFFLFLILAQKFSVRTIIKPWAAFNLSANFFFLGGFSYKFNLI
jgi:hypothetical protein